MLPFASTIQGEGSRSILLVGAGPPGQDTDTESFNNWVKEDKGKHLDDLMDTIRQKILIKWNYRKRVALKFEGKILPHIVQKLREESYNLDIEGS